MTTEERLERLEKKQKNTLWAMFALWGGILVLAIVGAYALGGHAREIRARAFIVVDGQGRERGKLETIDDKGISEVELCLYDEAGQRRAVLSTGKVLSTGLYLYSENHSYARLSSDDVSGSDLHLFDGNSKARAWLTLNRVLGPGLALTDENGKDRVTLSADNDQTGLALYDENGKNRAFLAVQKKIGSGMVLLNENGKSFWGSPRDP